MLHRIPAIICTLALMPASASVPLQASLSDLACGADHVLVGRVVGVDMIDADGHLVEDDKARTGPELKTRIRLHIEVQEVLQSTATDVPPLLKVSLDPFMHYSLGQIRNAYREPSDSQLLFLRGDNYEPVIEGRFFWELAEKDKVLTLRKDCRPQT